MTTDTLNLLTDLIGDALRAGATAADAVLIDSAEVSVGRRLDKPETLERNESKDLGLRVFVGHRQAIVSTTERSKATLAALVERAVAMAKIVPEDPYCGLADPELLATGIPDLDLNDPVEPTVEQLIDMTRACEQAALAVPGITNSDGAGAGWSRTDIAVAASNGFAGQYALSGTSVSASVLAEHAGAMERDYEYATAVYLADLEDPAEVGRKAGERTVRRLNPVKGRTATVPIVFDQRMAAGLLRHLTGAISGPSIARGTSFLKDQMGQQVFAPGIQIVDDPLVRRGFRSKPFDGEGLAMVRRPLVEDGVLRSWLLDLRSARQLGLTSTGHAARGTGGPPSPSPTNLFLAAGQRTPEELIGEIEEGFYVTELMGQGVSLVTGDYSRGASGFWIEKGKLTHAVAEVTIAGTLTRMFATMEAANDLVLRTGIDSPTVRVEQMMVAGQ